MLRVINPYKINNFFEIILVDIYLFWICSIYWFHAYFLQPILLKLLLYTKFLGDFRLKRAYIYFPLIVIYSSCGFEIDEITHKIWVGSNEMDGNFLMIDTCSMFYFCYPIYSISLFHPSSSSLSACDDKMRNILVELVALI